jgi:hypothetical protein
VSWKRDAFTAQILAGEIVAQIERGAAMVLRPNEEPGHWDDRACLA